MAIEKEEIYKQYTISGAALLTFIAAGAGEAIDEVTLDQRIEVKTKVGTNPKTIRTYCISLPDAKAALGIQNGEQFYSISWTTELIITTLKQTI